MKDSLLAVRDIRLELGGRSILSGIHFDVADGEFFSLLGPSGCGKTTLLRIIAGFQKPSTGELLWNGQVITNLPPQKRDLNLVFQNYALFPHMNVFENVAFGLRMQKLSDSDVRTRTQEALALVRMDSFAQRMIYELSGGQQQRIALARAVAPRPKLVLLDEPLGALDLQLRKQMQIELKSLQRQLGMTFIYVTHDQEEAFAMSDRIAILNLGHLEQVANPETLYRQPASKFVAQFIGTANFLTVQPESSTLVRCQSSAAKYAVFPLNSSFQNQSSMSSSSAGEVLVRPEQFQLSQPHTHSNQSLAGQIQMRQFLGAQVRYHVQLKNSDQTLVIIDVPSVGHHPYENGDAVNIQVHAAQLPYYEKGAAQ